MGAIDARKAILHAATTIVGRDGVAHLTIDAVAREAGLSKGGVLYHFPSKDALIVGMVTALIVEFEGEMRRATSDDPPPGRWLRTYVRASCGPEGTSIEEQTSLIAAVATNPRLLAPLQERYAAWQALAEADGLPPALATIIRLAVDGLWLADLFGLAPPRGELRAAVIETLLELARGEQR